MYTQDRWNDCTQTWCGSRYSRGYWFSYRPPRDTVTTTEYRGARHPLPRAPCSSSQWGMEAMPYAPPSRCPIPSCRKLTTTKGRCDDHQPKPWRNPSANTKQLTRRQRQLFHDAVIARDPICTCTGDCGTHTRPCRHPATEADHIIPISDHGARTDITNGRGLCSPCHSVITRHQNIARRRKHR